MKKLHIKGVKNKLILCIILAVLLCNFIMPNYTYAVDAGLGGKLLEAVDKLIAEICDGIMEWLQHIFVTTDDLQLPDESYNFQYSPGIIFSGTVPALDVNFIEPNNEVQTAFKLDNEKEAYAWFSAAYNSSSSDQKAYKDKYESLGNGKGYNKLSGTVETTALTYNAGPDPQDNRHDYSKYTIFVKYNEGGRNS